MHKVGKCIICCRKIAEARKALSIPSSHLSVQLLLPCLPAQNILHRSAISPLRLARLCKIAWHPQNSRKAPYTATALNTAVATLAPSFGSSFDPIREWLLLANMPPIVLRITIAKMEMTMHVHALKAETTGFIVALSLRRLRGGIGGRYGCRSMMCDWPQVFLRVVRRRSSGSGR